MEKPWYKEREGVNILTYDERNPHNPLKDL